MNIDCAGCAALFQVDEDGSTELREPEQRTPGDSEEISVSRVSAQQEERLASSSPEVQVPPIEVLHDWGSAVAPTADALELPEAEAPVASVMVNPARLGVNVQWPEPEALHESAAERPVAAAPFEHAGAASTPEEAVLTPIDAASTPEEAVLTPIDAASTPEEAVLTPIDAASTPEEAVLTPIDAASTPEEAVLTPIDAASTPEEAVLTPLDAASTPEEAVLTPIDAASTPEEAVLTPLDAASTPEEVVFTPLDAASTPEEAVFTPLDAASTAEEAVFTPLDAASTPEEVVLTPIGEASLPALGGEALEPEITAVYSLRELQQASAAGVSDEARSQVRVGSDIVAPGGDAMPITVPQLPPWCTHPASFMHGAAAMRVAHLLDVIPEAVVETVESGESCWVPVPEQTRVDYEPVTEPSPLLAIASAPAVEFESTPGVSKASQEVEGSGLSESTEVRTLVEELPGSIVEDEVRDAEFQDVLRASRSPGRWGAVLAVVVLGGVAGFFVLSGIGLGNDEAVRVNTEVESPSSVNDTGSSAHDRRGAPVEVGQGLEAGSETAESVEIEEGLDDGVETKSDGDAVARVPDEGLPQRAPETSTRPRSRARRPSVQRSASSKGNRARENSDSGNRARAERLYRQGNLFIQQNKFGPAISVLKNVTAINPRHGPAYRSLGISYMLLGRERQAIASYKRFVALDPNHRDAARVRKIIREYEQR